MLKYISAVENADDRNRALERVAELTGCPEQSPEEVELIMLTLALELWEMRQRADALDDLSRDCLGRPQSGVETVVFLRQRECRAEDWRRVAPDSDGRDDFAAFQHF